MKQNILMILVGVCIGITGVYIFWFFQLSKTVAQDHSDLATVVNFLNKQIETSKIPPGK